MLSNSKFKVTNNKLIFKRVILIKIILTGVIIHVYNLESLKQSKIIQICHFNQIIKLKVHKG